MTILDEIFEDKASAESYYLRVEDFYNKLVEYCDHLFLKNRISIKINKRAIKIIKN